MNKKIDKIKTKKGIAFLVTAFLAVVSLISALVCFVTKPSGSELCENCVSLIASEENGSIYYINKFNGTSLCKDDGNGNLLYSYESDEEYTNIFTTKDCPYLFARDSGGHISTFIDDNERLIRLNVNESVNSLNTIFADENYIYFVCNSGMMKEFVKFNKFDFNNNSFPLPIMRVELPYVSRDDTSIKVDYSGSKNISIVGSGLSKDGYINLFSSSGIVFKVKSDLDAIKTISDFYDDGEDRFDKNDTRINPNECFSYSIGLTISGCEYDYQTDTFLLLDVYGKLYSFNSEIFSLENRDVRNNILDFSDEDVIKPIRKIEFDSKHGPINLIAGDVAGTSISMYLHVSSRTLLIFFSNTNRVLGLNIDSNEVIFDAPIEYSIKQVGYNKDATKLFAIYSDVVDKFISYTSIFDSNIYVAKNYRIASLICLIVGILLALSAIILGMCAFSKKKEEKVLLILKDIVKQKFVYLIVLLSITALIIFCYYPAISSIVMSFTGYKNGMETMQWNNFQNYKDIFGNREVMATFVTMLILLIADLILAIIPPLIFAFFLFIMRNKGFSKLARMALFLPSILPGVAGILIWKYGIFGADGGALNSIVQFLTGHKSQVNFLLDAKWSLPSIIFMGFPYVGSYLIFYGALMNIPDSSFEEAELAGCNIFKRFVKIDIPLIFPQIKYVFILTIISSMQNFGRIYMTTQGSYVNVPVNEMYIHLLNGNYSLAGAFATILFVLLFAATLANMKNQMKQEG